MMPLPVNNQEFDQVVLEANGLVMVDLWAIWCEGCRMITPLIDRLADEYAGQAKVVKVNVDDHADHAIQYGVRHTPTVIFFRDGQEVDRIVGAGEKPHYANKLDALLG